MTTLSQAKQRLLTLGFDFHADGGGGYEIYREQIRVGRVYSDQDLIGWQLPTVLVGVPMMDQAEARATVDAIKGHMDSARKLLLDLEEREGWRALGYASWRACAQAEFGQSSAQVYRLLTAAKIEQAIDSPIGENPESHLRPLVTLDTPEQQKAALDRATELAGDRVRTAKDVQAAVEEIKPPARPPVPADLAGWHWMSGRPGTFQLTNGDYETRVYDHPDRACAGARLYQKSQQPDATIAAGAIVPDFAAVVARWDALGWRLLHDLNGPANDRYRLLPMDGRTVGIANMQWQEVLSRLEIQERRAAEQHADLVVGQRTDPHQADPQEPPPPTPDRASSSSFTSDEYQAWAETDQILLDKAANAIRRADYDVADVLLSQVVVKTAARDALAATLPSAPVAPAGPLDVRDEAIRLTTQLSPLLLQIHTEDLAALSMAIANLNECREGTEGKHLNGVIWAYLDVEMED